MILDEEDSIVLIAGIFVVLAPGSRRRRDATREVATTPQEALHGVCVASGHGAP